VVAVTARRAGRIERRNSSATDRGFAAAEGPLTISRGARRRRARHSTFCTSSRIFSKVAFISTTSRDTRTSADFEPIVLISRFISCAKEVELAARGVAVGSRITAKLVERASGGG
jgi:hypothetical protein